jgi:hypothetical protein
MKHRMADLEARRRVLLHRCEEQRLELAYRVAQIRPAAQLTAWTRRAGAKSAANHPLAWIAGAGGVLLMLLRGRRLLTGVGWVTALIALASRATTVLRLFAQFRAIYLGLKASTSKKTNVR